MPGLGRQRLDGRRRFRGNGSVARLTPTRLAPTRPADSSAGDWPRRVRRRRVAGRRGSHGWWVDRGRVGWRCRIGCGWLLGSDHGRLGRWSRVGRHRRERCGLGRRRKPGDSLDGGCGRGGWHARHRGLRIRGWWAGGRGRGGRWCRGKVHRLIVEAGVRTAAGRTGGRCRRSGGFVLVIVGREDVFLDHRYDHAGHRRHDSRGGRRSGRNAEHAGRGCGRGLHGDQAADGPSVVTTAAMSAERRLVHVFDDHGLVDQLLGLGGTGRGLDQSGDVVVPPGRAVRRGNALPQPIGGANVELDHVDPDLVARRCHSPRTDSWPPCPPVH